MIVKDLGDKVVCRDDRGDYTTVPDNIDNGLADPYRNSGRRF
jgi:hypothetical protein